MLIYEPSGRAREYAALALNVYKGCEHRCVYCLDGDTLVLKSDLSAVSLRTIVPGDEIVGVANLGSGTTNTLKFVPSVVEAVWTARKPVFEIELENGITAKCSGDHRWLTDRGWKFTTNAMAGTIDRAHLTTNNSIRLVSSLAITPQETDDYRLGYLSGVIRGDGHIGVHGPYHRRTARPNRAVRIFDEVVHSFSLRMKDVAALRRTEGYLLYFGVTVKRFIFNDSMEGIRTSAEHTIKSIQHLIEWRDTSEYARGFLAGIYDAEGSYSQVIRISNSDPEILRRCEDGLRTFGFGFVYDVPQQAPNCIVHSIRLQGGRAEIIRFVQLVNPAIERKRTISGQTVKQSSRVIGIKNLGYEDTLYDIQTSTGNFIANGMVSHNCYAPSATYSSPTDFSHPKTRGADFIPNLFREVSRCPGRGRRVLLCFTCDPYQPFDVEEGITRQAIHVLHGGGYAVEVLTKGGQRALRDLDLFGPGDAFATTLTLLDDLRSMTWEPGAALPGDRITTIEAFHGAGIETWVSLEPVLDPDTALEIIRRTHEFVDLYKVGKLNYENTLPVHLRSLVDHIDWRAFGIAAVDLLRSLGKPYYVKKDLAAFLPPEYQALCGEMPKAAPIPQPQVGQMTLF